MSNFDTFLPSVSFPGQAIEPFSDEVTVALDSQCPTAVQGFKIRFPGATFQIASAMNKIQTECDMIAKLQDAMAGLMVSLKPVFDLFDLIQKIIDCITAIPDAIANANPDPVIQCIPKLAEKLAEILAYLFPPISVPPMIADILCTIKTIMVCLANMVESVIVLEAQLEKVANLIANKGYTFLQSAHDLGSICRTSMLENLAGSTKPLQPLIGVANSIIALVPNFPTIPTFGDVTGMSTDEIKSTIDQFTAILGVIPDTCFVRE